MSRRLLDKPPKRSSGGTPSAITACSCSAFFRDSRTSGRSMTTIAAPRRASPRERVRAGSVGIAGQQTAVYPLDSPGGWQIIGHTRTAMFDAEQWPAALLSPGDVVRFHAQPHEARSEITSVAARRAVHECAAVDHRHRARALHDGTGQRPLGASVERRAGERSDGLDRATEPPMPSSATSLAWRRWRRRSPVRNCASTSERRLRLPGRISVPRSTVRACRTVRRCRAPAGGVLRFSQRALGARAYIAADGGIDVPRVLASRSDARAEPNGWHATAVRCCRAIDLDSARNVASTPAGGGRSRTRPHTFAPAEPASACFRDLRTNTSRPMRSTSWSARDSSSRLSRIGWATGCRVVPFRGLPIEK